MTERTVSYTRDGLVAIITLNRPHRRNALNCEAAEQLADCWRQFEADDARVVIITGAGEAAFCAGIDLDDPPDTGMCLPGAGIVVKKPIIAAVSGWAVGFGLTLTMMSDLAVAAESATFLYPEAKVGFTAGLVASLAVRIHQKQAMEIMLIGEPLSAEEGRRIGLVNKVVPDGRHLDEAMTMARKIAQRAPLVTRTLKELALATIPTSPAEDAAALRARMSYINTSRDRIEGRTAMSEKREPRFDGT